MKVIFLDIDGVLNSERSCHALDGYPHEFSPAGMAKFDNVAIGLIQQAVKETGASVVLSSTWRITSTVHECANGLGLPIFSATPRMTGPRGGEIAAWLREHPEVTSYVIVDDNSDMLDEQKPFFVQTDFRCGLSLDDYGRIVQLLGRAEAQAA